MKLKKKNLTKFDYFARRFFMATIALLVCSVAFLLPLASQMEEKCIEIKNEVQALENEKSVLLRDLVELETPTTTMSRD